MRFSKQVIGVLAFACLMFQSSSAMGQFFFFKHPLEGRQAPDFALKNLAGQTVQMSEYRAGQGAVIFFWATCCPHCRTQIQELYRRRDELLSQGVRIILIDLQEDARQVKDYLQRRDISFDVLLDVDAEVADAYQIVGIPSFFFVSQDGEVRAVKNLFPENYKQFYAKDSIVQKNPTGISAAQSNPEKAGIDE